MAKYCIGASSSRGDGQTESRGREEEEGRGRAKEGISYTNLTVPALPPSNTCIPTRTYPPEKQIHNVYLLATSFVNRNKNGWRRNDDRRKPEPKSLRRRGC